jgi:SMODS and SLOG-associating 2TM effector domain 1/Protein of unknown function (DUF4231)
MAAGIASEVWAQQSLWSQTADKMKKTISRARRAMLTCTILGATLGTSSAALTATGLVPQGRLLAALAAVAAASVPVCRGRCSTAALRDWTRARSVSEALKSETYLWLAAAGDYRGADRDRVLRTRADKVAMLATDLLSHTMNMTAKVRELPPVSDPPSYFRIRASGQIDRYYRPRAVTLRKNLRRLDAAQTALAGIGVILAGIAATYTEWAVGAWIAVATTIGAAIGAYSASGRLDYQIIEFLRTADELRRLRRAAQETDDLDELDRLVQESERVISIQNEGWMAKLTAQSTEEPEPA